jgi:hypothetical protein
VTLDVKRQPDSRPVPLLAGFVALLAVLFAVAYATGRLAGPVAPAMHRVAPGTVPARTAPAHDMPGMDMPGGRP